jgi:cytoskeletal protein CcmA (bactofilin family)
MARTPFATTPPTTPSIPPQPAPGQSPLSVRSSGFGQPAAQSPVRPAAAERRTLVVGRGISVQGTVQDAERLVVEGTVEATMIQATELSISQGGVFKGEAQVEEAEIGGTIDGTLTARGSLIVRGSGRVLGTARCKRLQVEDGGQITGRIEMLTEGSGQSPGLPPRNEPTRVTPETVG